MNDLDQILVPCYPWVLDLLLAKQKCVCYQTFSDGKLQYFVVSVIISVQNSSGQNFSLPLFFVIARLTWQWLHQVNWYWWVTVGLQLWFSERKGGITIALSSCRHLHWQIRINVFIWILPIWIANLCTTFLFCHKLVCPPCSGTCAMSCSLVCCRNNVWHSCYVAFCSWESVLFLAIRYLKSNPWAQASENILWQRESALKLQARFPLQLQELGRMACLRLNFPKSQLSPRRQSPT